MTGKLPLSHNQKQTIQPGTLATIHYIGKLADGTVFESTKNKPLRVFVGEHAVIQGLEEGIIGMHIGEKRRVIVQPNKGYGKHLKDLIQEIELNKVPREVTPAVGMVFTKQSRSGRTIYTKIIQVKRDTVIIDMNHPLAGKTLVFDVVVMDIQG